MSDKHIPAGSRNNGTFLYTSRYISFGERNMRGYLQTAEVKAFLAVGRRLRDTLMKKVLVQTGMRIGECCCLQVKDLEVDRERIRLSKCILQNRDLNRPELYVQDKMLTILVDGKKKRMFPPQIAKIPGNSVKVGLKANHPGRYVELINPETADQLVTFVDGRDPEEWLWTAQGGDRRLSLRQMQTIISDHLKKAGIAAENCHAHILRHTFAVHALKAGRDIAVVSRSLGHSATKTTEIYLRLVPEDVIEIGKKHPLPF